MGIFPRQLLGLALSLLSLTLVAQSRKGTLDLIPGQTIPGFDGQVVSYYLSVADTVVNFTGKPTRALATNGQIPAPVLRFTEGDSARLYVTNRTEGTVSFHWHGLLLPNKYDGVPLLNTTLIEPGDTYVASFPIVQHGTYWYHSHTELQEQKGLYGPIVIQPRSGAVADKEKVVVLSDFTEQRPHEVLRQIKRHTDWFAIKRDALQSYARALASGNLGKQLWLEWNRMPGMDLADVYYDAFLANGRLADDYADLAAGETLRLRVVNGSASSHFWLQFAGGKMKIVGADGLEVVPTEVDKLLIATAETYDIEVTLPADGRYEFRATSWDRYKHTSVWLGSGTEHPAPELPPVDYYALTQEMQDMMDGMPGMQMGKAPSNVPEAELYPAGQAPTNAAIQMQSMMDMGMSMEGMNHDGMDHGAMKQETMDHEAMKQGNMDHEGMDHEGMDHEGMDHSGMDHEAMGHDMPGMQSDTATDGKTYRAAEEDGKQMDTAAMPGMGTEQPMGVMMTGYYELQQEYPQETIFDYNMLRSPVATELPDDRPVRVVHLYLGGNMLRYVWMINNKPLSAADKIMVERGENVRFVFHNTTMMSHPMHLHGHFFRVINAAGAYAPLKHTVNVAPMETTIIEFAATEDKDWFFHCHLLYHMMSGMARIIGYGGSSDLLIADRADYDKFAMDDRQYFGTATLSAMSNASWADFAWFNLNKEFSLEGGADYSGNFEVEGKAMRYLDPRQYWSAYVGAELDGEREMDAETGREQLQTEAVALAGVRYFLPMMVWSDLRVDHRGRIELQLEREDIPLTSRWRASAGGRYNFMNQQLEYTFGTSYILGQYWGVAARYDSDYGLGAGLQIVW
ncbi:multicopper oxidase domain-containing protein [Lewinella sp. IMCC34183]|uniref:multicopper oxidase domain-containing protein n=1 Tax=Lewinella sp. IMCC34183 TaxID=2248762 RepID=UPI000E24EF9B|nr:multicopper oxidase domain-containing protein [Lewinella sp. IMCC34183]